VCCRLTNTSRPSHIASRTASNRIPMSLSVSQSTSSRRQRAAANSRSRRRELVLCQTDSFRHDDKMGSDCCCSLGVQVAPPTGHINANCQHQLHQVRFHLSGRLRGGLDRKKLMTMTTTVSWFRYHIRIQDSMCVFHDVSMTLCGAPCFCIVPYRHY
jgi:hypothetical protein